MTLCALKRICDGDNRSNFGDEMDELKKSGRKTKTISGDSKYCRKFSDLVVLLVKAKKETVMFVNYRYCSLVLECFKIRNLSLFYNAFDSATYSCTFQ